MDKIVINRLFEEIKSSGMTTTQIAKKIGINQNNFSQYKAYVSVPTLDTFRKICICINASADYILGLDDFK